MPEARIHTVRHSTHNWGFSVRLTSFVKAGLAGKGSRPQEHTCVAPG